MTHARSHEALYESEAALRLVDREIRDLGADVASATPRLTELPDILLRANAQIVDVLSRLRAARSAVQHSTSDRLQATHDKLRQVSSATEDAATNIMDACDRASQLVDELDAIDAGATPDREAAAKVRGTLRDELFHMMSALQFQDITTQQLTHASAVLNDLEDRMADVAKLFDASLDEPFQLPERVLDEQTFDPNATVKNAEGRQALADEIVIGTSLSAA